MITSLNELNILALDCQTTGAKPDKGRLLEIGWVETNLSAIQSPTNLKVNAFLFKLPDKTKLARSIQRITGITQENLAGGLDRKNIRQKLNHAAGQVMAANQSAKCPTVIHFARFEEPFLRDLFTVNDLPQDFLFQVICTHEIVRRLLPDLPRKGLRAIAGFFGYPLSELKRSADHARATALIWKHLVLILAQKQHIRTLAQLIEWLQNAPPVKGCQRLYPMDSKERRRVPDQPGIYRMLRANADVLYIGKATSLKKRVNSYFRPSGVSSEHILEMLTQAYRLDFTTTASALEAALLETDEIKHQSPPYNVALRRRQRRLVFASRDLQQFASTANTRYLIGPLPLDRLNTAMTAFATLISKGLKNKKALSEQTAYALLAVPKRYAPDKHCLCEGVHIFWERYRHCLNPGDTNHPLRILTGLGVRFWRDHMKRLNQDETSATDINDTEKSQTENGQNEWHPERVARAIENAIRRSSFLIRRARWFCLLSESALTWTSPAAENDHKFLLVLNAGTVAQRKILNIETLPPVPSGFRNPPHLRKSHIDLITYDRLRVLTTELRRLVSEDRHIELRLGPTAILNRRQLSKALRWV